MTRPMRKRKCQHCRTFFVPDPRNVGRQHYCAQPSCRQASKAASQRRWLRKPDNRDYFRGPAHVERVRQWRKVHPGYWRRESRRPADAPQTLQEPLIQQPLVPQEVVGNVTQPTLQDSFFMQPAVVVGLIAHFTGLSLQEDIAVTARRLQQLGHDILHGSPYDQGGRQDAQTSYLVPQAPQSAQAVQLGGSAPGP
jgi:hypothetical protein